jgi:hypothetical protein
VLFVSIYKLFKNIWLDQNVLWLSVLTSLAFSMFFDFYNLVTSPNIMWLWFWLPISMSLGCSRDPDSFKQSKI